MLPTLAAVVQLPGGCRHAQVGTRARDLDGAFAATDEPDERSSIAVLSSVGGRALSHEKASGDARGVGVPCVARWIGVGERPRTMAGLSSGPSMKDDISRIKPRMISKAIHNRPLRHKLLESTPGAMNGGAAPAEPSSGDPGAGRGDAFASNSPLRSAS